MFFRLSALAFCAPLCLSFTFVSPRSLEVVLTIPFLFVLLRNVYV